MAVLSSTKTIGSHTILDTQVPITIIRVSRRWREVAKTIKHIWTTISCLFLFDDALEDNSSAENEIAAWIRLSKTEPLSVCLDGPVLERYYDALPSIIKEAQRWRQLLLFSPPAVLQSFMGFHRHLDCLEELALDVCFPEQDFWSTLCRQEPHPRPTTISLNAPKLRRLTLGIEVWVYIHPNFFSSCWASLTQCYIPFDDRFAGVLAHMTALEDITLTIVNQVAHSGGGIILRERCQSLQLIANVPPVYVKRPNLSNFLGRLRAPAMHRLRINGFRWGLGELDLHTFEQYLTSRRWLNEKEITSLELQNVEVSDLDLALVISRCLGFLDELLVDKMPTARNPSDVLPEFLCRLDTTASALRMAPDLAAIVLRGTYALGSRKHIMAIAECRRGKLDELVLQIPIEQQKSFMVGLDFKLLDLYGCKVTFEDTH